MIFRQKDDSSGKKNGLESFNPAALPKNSTVSVTGEIPEGYTKHYLIPGKIFVGRTPHAITTILGSGIAICLWDQESGIGGANHFLLPEGPDNDANATRYASTANEALLRELAAMGADLTKLQAKIFGGSQPAITFGNTTESLGDRNVQVATHFLSMKGIPIRERLTGGTRGRKLIFCSNNGSVWAEQL